ncbi:MAG: GFA family protein [Pseudomonadota bacterium]
MSTPHARCLCGAQRFAVTDPLTSVRYCHCGNCRKFSGTSPAVWAMTRRSGLRIEAAAVALGRFDSGQGVRCFCTACGTPVWFESLAYPEIVGLPLGVLEHGFVPAQMHLWMDSKPAWCLVGDELRKHPRGP